LYNLEPFLKSDLYLHQTPTYRVSVYFHFCTSQSCDSRQLASVILFQALLAGMHILVSQKYSIIGQTFMINMKITLCCMSMFFRSIHDHTKAFRKMSYRSSRRCKLHACTLLQRGSRIARNYF
jgi:hypothetical protein